MRINAERVVGINHRLLEVFHSNRGDDTERQDRAVVRLELEHLIDVGTAFPEVTRKKHSDRVEAKRLFVTAIYGKHKGETRRRLLISLLCHKLLGFADDLIR